MTLIDPPSTQSTPPPSSGTPTHSGGRSGAVTALVLAGVALVFADASVVALALPDIYTDFGASIAGVSWVLTAYALAVAVAGGVGASVGRRTGSTVVAAGGIVFAAGSVASGVAPSLGVLIAARAVQGLGGAALVAGAFTVLVPLAGDSRRATRWWAAAGTAGAVAGPALGGLVTQLLDWRAVFLLQAPVAVAAVVAVLGTRSEAGTGIVGQPTGAGVERGRGPDRRPAGALMADVALGLTFAALVGALFLSVILLVVVWGMPPLAGAAVVIALPAATVASRWVTPVLGPLIGSLAGGALLAGGLAGLALLPAASPAWAAAALALCGLGFGLLAAAMGRLAVPADGGMRAANLSSAARHLGLVVGLAVVAPVLADDVNAAADDVPLPATQAMLDAPIDAPTKVRITLDIRDLLDEAPEGEVPDLAPVFDAHGAADDADVAALRDDMETQMREVLTRSFRAAFAIGAAFAAAAGLVAAFAITLHGVRPRTAVAGEWGTDRSLGGPARPGGAGGGRAPAVLAGAGLVVASLALPAAAAAAGGSDLGEFELADPCAAGADPYPGSGLDAMTQRLVLSGLNGAACELGTTREELVLSLEPRSGVDLEWDRDTIEQALRAGVDRAIEDADERDSLPGWLSGPLGWLADRVPLSWILEQLGIG